MTATYKSWAAGDVLLAADVMTYLMKQVNVGCTDTSDRPSSPAEGWRAMLSSLDREETYNGSAWVRTGWWGAAGRTGFRLRRVAAFSVSSGGTPTDVSWDTEDQDTDGLIVAHATTGTTVTLSSGTDGVWRFGGLLNISGAVFAGSTSNALLVTVVRGGVSLYFKAPLQNSTTYAEGSNVWCAFPSIPPLDLASGDTIKVGVRHDHGSARDVTGWFWGFREYI